MQDKIIEKLKEYSNIAILGFGREGKSTYNFIRKHDKNMKLTILDGVTIEIDDENACYKPYNNTDEELREYDLIIKTPGIAITNLASDTISKITSQMELLLEFNRKNVIGVTGSKGKSTTSSLIYSIFKDQMDNVTLVGNIGIPVLDEIDKFEDSIVVAEMSSHQLETVDFSPHVGIIVNLYLDHLDHTGSVENYHKSKMNIMRFQDGEDYGIYDKDCYYLDKQDFSKIKSNILTVSLKDKASIYMKDNGDIFINGEFLLNRDQIVTELKGDHNLKNILFALMVADIYHLNLDKALDTIKNFKPLEHRMELVGKYDDIIFYNDVIATIPEATMNACKTLENVNTLIFGGMDRSIKYDEFIEFLNKSNIKHFICMPTTGHMIAESLDKERVILVDTLEEAVDKAFEVTEKNSICILSPAAASYEFFKDFNEKGKRYKFLVQNHK
jgi:UDP-N-acetylmuramoylalanine--D-glutamate ligase